MDRLNLFIRENVKRSFVKALRKQPKVQKKIDKVPVIPVKPTKKQQHTRTKSGVPASFQSEIGELAAFATPKMSESNHSFKPNPVKHNFERRNTGTTGKVKIYKTQPTAETPRSDRKDSDPLMSKTGGKQI